MSSMDASRVGDVAAANGLRLHELSPRRSSLEDAFMELTHDSVAYRSKESGFPRAASAAPEPITGGSN